MWKRAVWSVVMISLMNLIISCGNIPDQPTPSPTSLARSQPATPTVPQPHRQRADQEYYWDQRLERDSIKPIYDPTFLPVAEANYQDDELVIGIEINGEAKAYAIGPLNGREMVNDTLGGVPILVTW